MVCCCLRWSIWLTGIIWVQMTEEVMLSAFAERGYVENNKYSNMISDENYNYMVISGRFDEPQTPLYITQKRPFVVHWFCGAYVGIKFNFSLWRGQNDGFI